MGMKAISDTGTPTHSRIVRTLTNVLGQSARVKELIRESSEELSTVNNYLKEEISIQKLPDGVANALQKSEVVKTKVQDAFDKLEVVNKNLEAEIRDRNMVDLQLAAAREQEESARYAAFHDLLTGLPNRALFINRLEHGFTQAKRHDWTLAVLFMDLDGFKVLNDKYGHEAGDTILKATAQRLKDTLRDEDTISRIGGDEFLYLLTEIKDTANIPIIAEKIIEAIRAPFDLIIDKVKVQAHVGVSIGIAVFPKGGTTVDMLVKHADAAMYQAKQYKSGYAFAA